MGIELAIWHGFRNFSLTLPQTLPGVVTFALYVAIFGMFLLYFREDFQRLTSRAWIGLGLALILVIPGSALLVLTRSLEGMLFPAAAGVLHAPPSISVAALVIVSGVSIFLGAGPGLLAGLMAGFARAWTTTQAVNDVLAFAVWGMMVGWAVHQFYQGGFFNVLRHPLVATMSATLPALMIVSSNRFVESLPSGGLVAIDHASTPFQADWIIWLLASFLVGLLFTILFAVFSELKPSIRPQVPSFFSRSLGARFMVALLPILFLGMGLSILAVTRQAVTLAREQALGEMVRSAENASEGIANFYYTGSNLLKQFASNTSFEDSEFQQQMLEIDRQVVPFFQELFLVDENGNIIAQAPPDSRDITLTEQELQMLQQSLDFQMFLTTYLTDITAAERRLTFIQPLSTGGEGAPTAALLGRVQLSVNPNMRRALKALQSTRGVGTGFILDSRGLIIAHPDPDLLLRPWQPGDEGISYPVEMGTAYESMGPEGDRVLTYVRNVVEGGAVVIQLPFSAVLEAATFISNPLLYIQLVIGLTLAFIVPVMATRVTKPLQTLSQAAHQIAQGNLSIPVHISGADEVARLGRAFEQMRVRLSDRLNDLSLLLGISRSVSATLDLDEGVPLILEGVLEETHATTARFILLGEHKHPQQVFSVGKIDAVFPGLDRALVSELRQDKAPLISQNLQTEPITPSITGPLQSVAAFPVRTYDRTVAVLWVGAEEAEAFDEARVNFLNTLVGQAAVLVENARLFQAAEGGRRRLAAILSSTNDAILVTDQHQRLVLINPAAQRILRLDAEAYGRSITRLNLPVSLELALVHPHDEDQAMLPTVEMSLDDGRIFFASIALVTTMGGERVGRVVVMRDVTHFKELDEMKSEFVATVSHDLRAPLTFIRGYATMLMMVGNLNDKQHDYLERILQGIEQMSDLIDDLLNLRRIEAGVGIGQESCRLGVVLVEAVDTMRARATAKGITLRLEPTNGSPTVVGDPTLLRQSIGNLVDNAIKYTPTGGQVSVGMRVNRSGEAVVHVTDTGIGIGSEEQPRLFEKFYRIKRRETGDIPGTGLGLALVKSIVERHEGRVWVESELNKGSTFYIALPIEAKTKDR